MKLVELLARELMEWKEGAAYASQDKDMEARLRPRCNPDFFATELAVDASSAYGRTDGASILEMWEAERAKMGVPQWNGEGLPPIGVVCLGLSEFGGDWQECEVVAHHKGSAIAVFPPGGAMASRGIRYRPSPSAEQIAARERELALDDIYRIMRTVDRPGNKTDMAEALYAAGYRKQEKSE